MIVSTSIEAVTNVTTVKFYADSVSVFSSYFATRRFDRTGQSQHSHSMDSHRLLSRC
jgi:hypothetical protein